MSNSSLFYSTETGATFPECEKSIDQCSKNPYANPKDGLIIVISIFQQQRTEWEDYLHE